MFFPNILTYCPGKYTGRKYMHTFKTLLSYRALGCEDVCVFACVVEVSTTHAKSMKEMRRLFFL